MWAGLPGVHGDYRLRKHIHLAGEERSETIYKEHGCLFKIDVSKIMWAKGNVSERKRIASVVRENENPPFIKMLKPPYFRGFLSISHTGKLALASVIFKWRQDENSGA